MAHEQPSFQLGYISLSVDLMTDCGLDELLLLARKNNEKHNVTGMLLYYDGAFVQIIEGPPNAIHQLTKNIEQDESHNGMKTLFEQTVNERSFKDWSMGFKRLQSDQAADIPGLNRFLEDTRCLAEHVPEQTDTAIRVRNILLFFRQNIGC